MIRLVVFTFSLTFNLIFTASAQFAEYDVRDFGMASSSGASIPVNSISKNPSVFPVINKRIISCQVISHFLIPEVSPISIKFLSKQGKTTLWSAGLGKMGNRNFFRQYFEAGISKLLTPKLSVGITLNYSNQILSESGYENQNGWTSSIGLFSNPFKDFFFGVIIRNPVRSRMNTIDKTDYQAEINPAISYTFSNKLNLAISALQQSNLHLTFQSGLEYHFLSPLYIRCGIENSPFSQSFGLGFNLPFVNMDLGFRTHPFLGNSSAIALTFVL